MPSVSFRRVIYIFSAFFFSLHHFIIWYKLIVHYITHLSHFLIGEMEWRMWVGSFKKSNTITYIIAYGKNAEEEEGEKRYYRQFDCVNGPEMAILNIYSLSSTEEATQTHNFWCCVRARVCVCWWHVHRIRWKLWREYMSLPSFNNNSK